MTNDPINKDKKVLIQFEKIDSEFCEYEKKQLCILLLASTVTPISCKGLSNLLDVLSDDMNTEWIQNDYPDQLNNR